MRPNRWPGRRVALGLCTAVAVLLAPTTAAQAAPTWTQIASGTSNEITGVEYQSAQRFWFVTAGGEIFTRQGNGGFTQRYTTGGVPLSRIAFQPGGNVGIAIGPLGQAYRSVDGGQGWSPIGGLAGRNADCSANEPLGKAFSVRWASNDVAYIFGGNKILRSTTAGATWTDANALSPTGCKTKFNDTETTGVSDAFFSTPTRGWLIGGYFGELYSAGDITANTPFQDLGEVANGYAHGKRLVGDPANPARQWAMAPEEDGNGSYMNRTVDGWASKAPFLYPGRVERAAPQDIAFSGGTLLIAGSSGQIENATDGVNLYYAGAGGAIAGANWRAADLASGVHGAVGGVGGVLAVTDNANSIGTTGPPVQPPCRVNCTPVKPRAKFTFKGKGEGVRKPTYGRDKKGRRTVTIKVKGRLGVPAGVNKALACRGNITVTLNHRRKNKWRSIGIVRKAKVSTKTCAYSKTIKFLRKKVKGKKLRVKLAFPGNTVVARADYGKTLTLKR